MQAYGFGTIMSSLIGMRSCSAYWPTLDSSRNHIKDPGYRDNFSSNRSKGLFMRNRIFADSNYIPESATRVSLFSGSFIQSKYGSIEKYWLDGPCFYRAALYYNRRQISVYKHRCEFDSDPTSPYFGKWVNRCSVHSYKDSINGPKTLGELENFVAQSVSKLAPPLSTEPTGYVSAGLMAFDLPEYKYSNTPSEVMALLVEDYQWFSTFGQLSTRDRRAAAQAAYVKAAEGIPQVTSNTFANVLEAASMLSNLLKGDFKKSTNLIGDAWLAYRYSYCTTKADIEEYQNYVQRVVDLCDLNAPPRIRCHGTFVDVDGWKYHCSMTVKTGDALPRGLLDTLRSFGLELSAVNVWDMIPYSFIVDWFIPVSDSLDLLESQWKSQHLPIVECWMSVASPKGDQYFRFPYKWDNVIPSVKQKSVSDKTLWMRVADAISLLL